jgi:hypothetical protein
MSDTETTWANGFGTWYALVRRDRQGGHVVVARGLIRAELAERGDKLTARVVRAPLYDTPTHIAFCEGEAS